MVAHVQPAEVADRPGTPSVATRRAVANVTHAPNDERCGRASTGTP